MEENEKQFLGLTPAAKKLGVHPATLRRWADQGDVLCVVTPGGHRRFLRSEIESLLRQRGGHADTVGDELIETALMSTRSDIEQMKDARWMSAMSEEQRNHLRDEGQKVMGLLRDYLAPTADRNAILKHVRDVGHSYAQSAMEASLTLAELLEAVSFFRSHILETAVEKANVSADERRELFRAVNGFLNSLLLSVAVTFEGARAQ